MLKKTLATFMLAMAACCIATAQSTTKAAQMKNNPLLQKSKLPYGAPDFSKITATHYLPAVQQAIAVQRDNIQKITDNKKPATFDNTIVALERSGELLEHVTGIFYAVNGAHKTDDVAAVEKDITTLVTAMHDEINFNTALFERVKTVYDNERATLQGEDLRLLEETYKSFVRAGAMLSTEKKQRMGELNKRLADLQQQFTTMLPKATAEAAVWVDSREELQGLSDDAIAQAQKDAERRGGKAPYCIVIANYTQQPILAQLANRSLRKRIHQAAVNRANGTGNYNTSEIITEIVRLRAEKAQLMGYDSWAAFTLENKMAKTPERVQSFLRNLINEYRPKAEAETREIEAYAQKLEGDDFQLEAYDRFFYSAKMKAEQFQFSSDDVKPYFNIDSVLVNGVFYAANRVYGLTFVERHDLPTYHPDMRTFEVRGQDGKTIALFYTDYFRRPTKRGGAWMSSFQKQCGLNGQIPIIYNVLNVAKAPDGQPTLLTWDETQTLFHEFGHALHGMLSQCKYNTLRGTAVPRDFVEMPSQFNEYFASVPEIFTHYALHTETGKPMPADLREKMLQSNTFHAAYALGENLAASSVDLQWHMLRPEEVPAASGIQAFETGVLAGMQMLDKQIPPRYASTYFNHVWGSGYAAGYYSYLWTEVLAVNIADTFTRRGPLDPAVGQDFRNLILSKGYTVDLMNAFSQFTGLQEPDASGFLKARGL